MGSQIHLDHTDDRQGYRGLAHALCNLSAAGLASPFGPRYARITAHCLVCSQPYETTVRDNATPRRQTCSSECRRSLYWVGRDGPTSRIYVKDCGWCSAPFVTGVNRQLYCCKDHGRRGSWAKSNAARYVTAKQCPCGAPIDVTRHKCDTCRMATRRAAKQRYRRTPGSRASKRRYAARRRAILKQMFEPSAQARC
jgi:hypothetical protein